MIELHGVNLVYPNNVHALHDIDLHIEKGGFVFLVGATGSGKTSLLKLIYREEIPTTGEIFVDTHDLSQLNRSRIPYLRRKIGVVFQDFKLLPYKTIYENIAYVLEVTGAASHDIQKRVKKVLEMVSLTEKSEMLPGELSGGEQQRASIARALANRPLILLADEPTGNLDPDTSWELVQLLDRVNTQGTTVIVATHNKSIVDAMKKRVVVLNEGRIAYDEEKASYIPNRQGAPELI
ncbi:MAG: cell division ATP-binding protein FtsE [Firmicutes bacterium]|nr:cell division ATP-binding protein FtsE [Bacillota bacterium]